jgi:hypothetical protein
MVSCITNIQARGRRLPDLPIVMQPHLDHDGNRMSNRQRMMIHSLTRTVNRSASRRPLPGDRPSCRLGEHQDPCRS